MPSSSGKTSTPLLSVKMFEFRRVSLVNTSLLPSQNIHLHVAERPASQTDRGADLQAK